MHFRSCKLPVEMCPKCRRYLAERLTVEGRNTMDGCEVQGCTRTVHARGMCGLHYQQWRKGRDPFAAAPGAVDRPGWTPPSGLSAQWQDRNVAKPQKPLQGRSCGLQACGGIAVHGSPYCAAHKAYRDAQAKLNARLQHG